MAPVKVCAPVTAKVVLHVTAALFVTGKGKVSLALVADKTAVELTAKAITADVPVVVSVIPESVLPTNPNPGVVRDPTVVVMRVEPLAVNPAPVTRPAAVTVPVNAATPEEKLVVNAVFGVLPTLEL